MISSARMRAADRGLLLGLCALAALAAGGCGSTAQVTGDRLLGTVTPYRVEIIQGNALTREQVTLIRPGMTRLQVREVLGSPMLADPFHDERWDYVFTIRRPGTPAQRRHVIARFDGDVLQALDAPGDLPSEKEFVASIDPARRQPAAPGRALELTEAERAALPQPVGRVPAPAPAGNESPAAPPRAYPPLER